MFRRQEHHPHNGGDTHRAWHRRLAGVIALLLVVSAATPLLASPRIRAGVVRRITQTLAQWRSFPAATSFLEVPFFRQERALSCEAAALRMALAYRGVQVSEQQLRNAIGTDPTPREVVRGGMDVGLLVWGNPDEAFVGDVDGIMGKTGYGVHAGPIGRVAARYRRAEVLRSASSQVLADAIAAGNPVIAWGHLNDGRAMTWETPGGKRVHAVNGEHTRVVVGYTGSTEEPTGFHVLDPIYGAQYWPLAMFMKNWEKLGRSAVMIY